MEALDSKGILHSLKQATFDLNSHCDVIVYTRSVNSTYVNRNNF